MLTEVPDGSAVYVAPFSAVATVAVIVCIALRATGPLRLWTPVIGVIAGSVVAALFGLYDADRVAEASWFGLPSIEWPGLDLAFGPAFWSLMPAFLLVTPIVTLRSARSCVAVQSVSWPQRRAKDFRAVQGAVNVDGTSNLLCGLAGTVPNSALSASASLAEITGVAARSVGVATGAIFILLALVPKALAVVPAIPSPVVAGHLAVLMAMLVRIGIKVLLPDGLDNCKGLIVGVAFWIGVEFQNGMVYPELVSQFAGGLLLNGMTSGGLTAFFLTLFLEMTVARRSRMDAEPDLSALSAIREFLQSFAWRNGWGSGMAARLDAVGEEALLTLIKPEEFGKAPDRRRLRLVAYRGNGGAALEDTVARKGENIQDRLVLLGGLAAAGCSHLGPCNWPGRSRPCAPDSPRRSTRPTRNCSRPATAMRCRRWWLPSPLPDGQVFRCSSPVHTDRIRALRARNNVRTPGLERPSARGGDSRFGECGPDRRKPLPVSVHSKHAI